MSDLRTEIVSKVLNSWDTPTPTQTAASETISEKIFNFIHSNPSCTSNDVVDNTNVDLGRASATLLSLYQKGKVDRRKYPNPKPDGKRDNVYVYWTTVDSHKEKGVPRLMKPKKQKKPYIHKALANLEAPKPVYQMPRMKQVVIKEAPTKQEFDAEQFVKGLTLSEVKALYEALKGYFA
jgi:predicted transcriptional regulator